MEHIGIVTKSNIIAQATCFFENLLPGVWSRLGTLAKILARASIARYFFILCFRSSSLGALEAIGTCKFVTEIDALKGSYEQLGLTRKSICILKTLGVRLSLTQKKAAPRGGPMCHISYYIKVLFPQG